MRDEKKKRRHWRSEKYESRSHFSRISQSPPLSRPNGRVKVTSAERYARITRQLKRVCARALDRRTGFPKESETGPLSSSSPFASYLFTSSFFIFIFLFFRLVIRYCRTKGRTDWNARLGRSVCIDATRFDDFCWMLMRI